MHTVPTTTQMVRLVGLAGTAIALSVDPAARALRITAAPKPLARHRARRKPGGEPVAALLARLAPAHQPADAPLTQLLPAAGPVTAPLVVPGLRPSPTGGTR